MLHGVDDERLQNLIDREEVRGVVVRIALAQDARDWDGLAECFEPDATYVHPGGRTCPGPNANGPAGSRGLNH